MDMLKRIKAAKENEAAKKERTLAKLESLQKQIHMLNEKNKPRREKVKQSLANKQARPLVDLVTDCQSKAIKDVTNKCLQVTPAHSLGQTKPQLYSPRKSKPAKFEKTETRMLRSYLEKNDEFVNEEFFLKEMIQKFGPKILQSYPELWNEREERIERLRAETNLNIKESANELKTSLLAEKDKKIKELNLNETDRLKSICESLQIESDKCKAQSRSLIQELIQDKSIQDALYNMLILTAEKEVLESSQLPIPDTPAHDDMHAHFIGLKTEKRKLLDLIKKKTERLSRFSGRSSEYIDMMKDTKPKTETSASSLENDIERCETNLLGLKGNLSKVPADQKDKYSDMISSTRTFESAGEIIAENEFNDICNLGSFNVLLDRVGLGINDLESQQKKITKRIKKQTKEVKQEYESANEVDLDKVVQNVQSYCDLRTKNLNAESIRKFDSVFQSCFPTIP